MTEPRMVSCIVSMCDCYAVVYVKPARHFKSASYKTRWPRCAIHSRENYLKNLGAVFTREAVITQPVLKHEHNESGDPSCYVCATIKHREELAARLSRYHSSLSTEDAKEVTQ